MPSEWGTETSEEMVQVGDRDVGGDSAGGGDVLGTAGREGLVTNCMSCCSCIVRAARVILMLFSEICCFSMSS